MSLREDLEYIWEKLPCLAPMHLVRWNFRKVGWWVKGKIAGLWFTRGKLLNPKKKRRRF